MIKHFRITKQKTEFQWAGVLSAGAGGGGDSAAAIGGEDRGGAPAGVVHGSGEAPVSFSRFPPRSLIHFHSKLTPFLHHPDLTFTYLQGLKALGIPLGPRRALVLRYGRPADVSRGLNQADNQNGHASDSSAIASAGQFGRAGSGASVGAGGVSARVGGGGMAVDALADISRAVQFAVSDSSIGPSGGGFGRSESFSRRAARIDIGDFGSEVAPPIPAHHLSFLFMMNLLKTGF